MKYIKSRFVILILISITVLSFFFLSYLNNMYFKNNLKPNPYLIHENTKIILFWLAMWTDKTFSFNSSGYEPFKYCKFKNCYTTHDRGFVPVDKFAAVIFHGAQFEPGYRGPRIRLPNQRYIFTNMESPVSCNPARLEWYASYYNWTMTYRIESDIPMRYAYIIKNNTNYVVPNVEHVKNKTNLAAWVVSHCSTTNKRMEVAQELKKYLKIDIYGRCGPTYCPGEWAYNKLSVQECYDFIEKNYKFYLAFENSHCRDYITEKVYFALERDMVPIAYGFANYEHFTPPNSVIVADKFQNIKQLANYILYLDKNPEEYLKYFEWKKYYTIEINPYRTACTLCRMINDPLEPPKIYEDISTWWLGENNSYCKIVPDLFKTIVSNTSTVTRKGKNLKGSKTKRQLAINNLNYTRIHTYTPIDN